MAPKGGLSHHLRREQYSAQYNKTNKIQKENTKTHSRDVERPPWGVMHPWVRITGWKGQRGELGREIKHEQMSA